MTLKELTREEIETLSYADITYLMLRDEEMPMTTPTIFKKICNLLSYSEDEYNTKIGDFYTSLTTDKRFILLESAEWDLKEKHIVKLELEEEEEEEEIDEETEIEEEEIDDITLTDDLDDNEEDIDDLSIIEEEEIEEN